MVVLGWEKAHHLHCCRPSLVRKPWPPVLDRGCWRARAPFERHRTSSIWPSPGSAAAAGHRIGLSPLFPRAVSALRCAWPSKYGPKLPSVLVDRPRSLSASRPCMVHADFTLNFSTSRAREPATGTDPSNQKSLWKTSASDRDVREPSFWPRRGPCRDHRGARGRACARRNGLRAATNAHVRPSFRKAASIRLMRPHRVMMPSVSRKGRPTRASRARARRRATDRRLRTASRPRRG